VNVEPPYYAVIFSSKRTDGDRDYEATAERMVELARGMPGFLDIESVRGADGFGITVSYWHDEASIVAWRQHSEHLIAQERGRREWYVHYDIRIAKVERAYAGPAMRQS
jgi:heme-degrading monooxygenase HmoA